MPSDESLAERRACCSPYNWHLKYEGHVYHHPSECDQTVYLRPQELAAELRQLRAAVFHLEEWIGDLMARVTGSSRHIVGDAAGNSVYAFTPPPNPTAGRLWPPAELIASVRPPDPTRPTSAPPPVDTAPD